MCDDELEKLWLWEAYHRTLCNTMQLLRAESASKHDEIPLALMELELQWRKNLRGIVGSCPAQSLCTVGLTSHGRPGDLDLVTEPITGKVSASENNLSVVSCEWFRTLPPACYDFIRGAKKSLVRAGHGIQSSVACDDEAVAPRETELAEVPITAQSCAFSPQRAPENHAASQLIVLTEASEGDVKLDVSDSEDEELSRFLWPKDALEQQLTSAARVACWANRRHSDRENCDDTARVVIPREYQYGILRLPASREGATRRFSRREGEFPFHKLCVTFGSVELLK